MPDLFEQQDVSAFALPGDEELVGAPAEPEAEVAVETPEVEAESETAERPRDEQGRFTAEDETPAEEAPAPEEQTDDDLAAYLAKYGGDQDKALKAAVEAQKLIGRKESELQEMRDLMEQRFDALEQNIQQDAPNYDLQQVQDRLAERPDLISQVADAAYREGNDDILAVAMVAWSDHDPYAAERFRMQVASWEAEAAIDARAQAAQAKKSNWTQSAAEFGQKNPDFNKYAAAMQAIAPEYPHMLKILEAGTKEAQTEVLDFLYEKARRRESDTVTAQNQEVKAATAADTDRAIEDAAVTSGTATHTEEKLSPAEQLGKIWEEGRRPYDEGWNVG